MAVRSVGVEGRRVVGGGGMGRGGSAVCGAGGLWPAMARVAVGRRPRTGVTAYGDGATDCGFVQGCGGGARDAAGRGLRQFDGRAQPLRGGGEEERADQGVRSMT